MRRDPETEPARFNTSLATPAQSEILLTFFDGAVEPRPVAMLLCSTEAARALKKNLGSVIEPSTRE